MVKKQTSKSSGRKSTNNASGVINVLEGVGRKELYAFTTGFILVVFSVFLLIAFTSYLYSGSSDFDLLENPTGADISNEGYVYRNVCGSLGAILAFFFLNNCFGLASYLIPVFLILAGFRLMNVYKIGMIRSFMHTAFIMVWLSVMLSFVSGMISWFDTSFINLGGNHGKYVVKRLTALVGTPGLFGLLFMFAIFYLICVSAKTIEVVRGLFRLNMIKNLRRKYKERHTADSVPEDTEVEAAHVGDVGDAVAEPVAPVVYEDPKTNTLEFDAKGNIVSLDINTEVVGGPEQPEEAGQDAVEEEPAEGDAEGDTMEEEVETEDGDIGLEIVDTSNDASAPVGDMFAPYDPKLDLELYKYPPLELLEHYPDSNPQIDMDEQNANKERIIQILRSFGVEISSIKATIGPTITLYEITPAVGVKIAKIRNLEDDIALSLAAVGIRIIAPIPGKGTIGIEVPNKKQCIVSMESILNSRTYQETKMELPCALGKTITNEVYMIDLAKAPHLLVAGATGMGKSVGLNAIVTSLLYKKHPSELKIVMVDPKKVEFSIYAPIENHFLAKLEDEDEAIITDVQKVVNTLKSLCQVMDTRYDLLKKAKVRNIKEYNAKFKARELNPENGHEFMPYIVVIIDEFGDLIMTAGKEIELPICRIAQLARAVGIHMIIATQRPTTNIITGTIKANFPARIAFRVAAMMDSRTILDRSGANQLIGRGDMLYLQGAEPVRVQCAFVDTPEVSRICNYISTQQSYPHAMYLPEVQSDEGGFDHENTADMKHLDPMFAEVAKLVVSTQQGSTSLIQRKFSIGYNRAGRLMDQLEKAGVVGAQQGSKPRDVLISDLVTLDSLLNNIG
ncbi:MAG: DNA translocase FtsK [Bacteroides sp.]|nr:DNA translocase FtsK [Roseburia sp.]MCM1345595.1 DNA translocase FtsK [Bacteroides sp.]MCM1421921.1 DNA translocase FtsK [Bacteroides sp.]